jgi:hypothetical protein
MIYYYDYIQLKTIRYFMNLYFNLNFISGFILTKTIDTITTIHSLNPRWLQD